MVQRLGTGKSRKLWSLDIRCRTLWRNIKKTGVQRKARVGGKMKYGEWSQYDSPTEFLSWYITTGGILWGKEYGFESRLCYSLPISSVIWGMLTAQSLSCFMENEDDIYLLWGLNTKTLYRIPLPECSNSNNSLHTQVLSLPGTVLYTWHEFFHLIFTSR